jgi:hypothetical protein
LPFNLPPSFIVDLAFNCANYAAMTIQHAIGQLQDPTQYKIWSSEVALFMILACGGAWVGYSAFDRAGKSRNIGQTLGWSLVVALSALIASYGLILLMVLAV